VKSTFWALLVTVASIGCQRPTSVSARSTGSAAPVEVKAAPSPASTRPEVLDAPAAGDVVQLVKAEQLRAQHDGRRLVIYVSAAWCGPCKVFQKALDAGELDAYFPNLRLMKFDSDRDNERLAYGEYDGAYIPRFVVPGPDGYASGKRFEGGINGEGGIAHIGRQLQALLLD